MGGIATREELNKTYGKVGYINPATFDGKEHSGCSAERTDEINTFIKDKKL